MAEEQFAELGDFDGLMQDLGDAVDSGEATVIEETEYTVSLDINDDGLVDVVVEDYDEDGVADTINVDQNDDGIYDLAVMDSDQNGLSETILAGGDEINWGEMYVDEDEDGITDASYNYDAEAGEWIEDTTADIEDANHIEV